MARPGGVLPVECGQGGGSAGTDDVDDRAAGGSDAAEVAVEVLDGRVFFSVQLDTFERTRRGCRNSKGPNSRWQGRRNRA